MCLSQTAHAANDQRRNYAAVSGGVIAAVVVVIVAAVLIAIIRRRRYAKGLLENFDSMYLHTQPKKMSAEVFCIE